MTSLSERLQNNEIILLDGGVSTEIQRRGVAMDSAVWSGIAHKTHPDVVREVHEDYIRAGAQVITANTFSTARHGLESIGLGGEVASINEQAVRLAQAARDNAATSDVWIAGSISTSPGFNNPREVAMSEQARANYRELAEILAETGVDLIIAEMMMDLVSAPMVVEASLATGLPVWVGYSAMLAEDGVSVQSWRLDGAANTTPPDDFDALVAAVSPLGGEAAGVMHSRVEHTGPALEVLQRHWSGPRLVYAETGWLEKPDWIFEEICSPEAYLAAIEGWISKYGTQIVGGCCGTGPAHIRLLKERLPHRLPA
jgi:homocysteine S-methyltransferase